MLAGLICKIIIELFFFSVTLRPESIYWKEEARLVAVCRLHYRVTVICASYTCRGGVVSRSVATVWSSFCHGLADLLRILLRL
jgi:hypothetical protein